jgi:hypothetical protein
MGIDSYDVKRHVRWYRTNGVWASTRKAEAQRKGLLHACLSTSISLLFYVVGWVVDCGRPLPVVEICQDVVEIAVEVDVIGQLDNKAETGGDRSF